MDQGPGGMEQPEPAPDPPARTPTAAAAAVVCALCATSASSPPLSWMYEADRTRGGRWYCGTCARRHLRAVEAKLDQQWW